MMYHRVLIICNNGSHYDILYIYSVFVFWSYQHPHNPSFTPPFWLTFIFPINHTHSKIIVIYFSLYHSHTGFELPFKSRIDVTCLCSWGPCCDTHRPVRQGFSSGPHRLHTVPGATALLSPTRQFNWLPYQLGRVVFHPCSLQSILLLTGLRTEGESVLGFLLLFACLLVLLLLGFCCSLVYVPESVVF